MKRRLASRSSHSQQSRAPSPSLSLDDIIQIQVSGNTELPWFKQLYAMVIRRAAVDRVLYLQHPLPKLAKIGQAADAWIQQDESSFLDVCEVLGLHPDVVRVSIVELDEEEARALRGLCLDDGE